MYTGTGPSRKLQRRRVRRRTWEAGNRTPLNGYKVVFVPFSDGRPSGPAQDVVTGFLDANNHARGRPVGLAVDRTGGLLIADDCRKTRFWRVYLSSPRSSKSPAS